jgi:hypothetical protein
MTDQPLIENYHSFMAETWDGTEDEIPMGMIRKADGSIIMVALALEPEQAYQFFLTMVVDEEATEAVFSLDRFTQPGQGTKYADVLAGHYFDRALGKSPWRPFVIEYRKDPRLFEPVDYDNAFWNETLNRELNATMRSMVRQIIERTYG